ncbi:uncharacterized protein DEA37_0008155 [Paragonimus westermani]|uniref:NEK6-subfamily protein kinase n=1 Tax=Paragonimus westermani TaxID=34504 RepID=A0A5J4NXE4_9TREM|nr:uncharacterized protein DEA37_0008155 [Paragonimus westermani]
MIKLGSVDYASEFIPHIGKEVVLSPDGQVTEVDTIFETSRNKSEREQFKCSRDVYVAHYNSSKKKKKLNELPFSINDIINPSILDPVNLQQAHTLGLEGHLRKSAFFGRYASILTPLCNTTLSHLTEKSPIYLEQFLILGIIGLGQFSTVYRARYMPDDCQQSSRLVALKIVKIFEMMDAKARKDCIQEIDLLKVLSSPQTANDTLTLQGSICLEHRMQNRELSPSFIEYKECILDVGENVR